MATHEATIRPFPAQGRSAFTKKTVSVMPLRNDLNARNLKRFFDVTVEEYLVLKLCASAPKPSECTAAQRRVFQRLLQKQILVEVIEYPCFDGPRWVLSSTGQIVIETVPLLTGVKGGPTTTKVLQFPSPR